jgi:hypothetical protein
MDATRLRLQESSRLRRIPVIAMLSTIFGFEMPTRLLFGHGAVENLGFECSLNGWASALIVTDAGVHKAGLTQPVEAQLQAQGVRYSLYTGIVPNPTIDSRPSLPAVRAAPDVARHALVGSPARAGGDDVRVFGVN